MANISRFMKCSSCGSTGHHFSNCPKTTPMRDAMRMGSLLRELAGVRPTPKPKPIPLEDRVKAWAIRCPDKRKILLFLCAQEGRKASVFAIGNHAYDNRMKKTHYAVDTGRKVRRHLREMAKDSILRPDSFYITFDGKTACVVDCTP